jgi:alkylation response protein AidB-like acyl-CoA dehydrogenase
MPRISGPLPLTIEARLKSDLRDAARAAERAHEALDEFVGVARARGIDQKEEERIRSHPLVQAELRRQRVDLSQLE